MNHVPKPYQFLFCILLIAGCSTPNSVKRENGPEGTVAYAVQIESSEPGARIEANGDYVGKTPMTLKIFGDKDGTFHNFGSYDYVIRAFPVKAGQRAQTKVFRCGGWFSPEDKIPTRIFFDLDEQSGGFSIDLPKPKRDSKQQPDSNP